MAPARPQRPHQSLLNRRQGSFAKKRCAKVPQSQGVPGREGPQAEIGFGKVSGMCHLQPRSGLREVAEQRAARKPLCAHSAAWRPHVRARTRINCLTACFLITNLVSSASPAVACPVKRHESQGIPQQQPQLKVRISVASSTSRWHHHPFLAPRGAPSSPA